MALEMVFVLKSKPKGNTMVGNLKELKKKKNLEESGAVAQHLKMFYKQR